MVTLSLSRGFLQFRLAHFACIGFLVNNVNAVVQPRLRPHRVPVQYSINPSLVARMSHNDSSAISNPIPDVSYEELRKLLDAHAVFLMDVREPKELRDDGKIPGSINVPLGEVEAALKLPADKFTSKYGAILPSPDESEKLVMTCRSGKRATNAAILARKHGFDGVRCYCGSFLDWLEKGGPIEKP